jgi:phosphate transport system permease protein
MALCSVTPLYLAFKFKSKRTGLMTLERDKKISFLDWCRGGEPLIWINAAAVTISIVAVVGLLLLLALRGFGHFWPADVMSANYTLPGQQARPLLGEVVEDEYVPLEQILSSGIALKTNDTLVQRSLIKAGNRDVTGSDFSWVINSTLSDIDFPKDVMVIERREWGNFYGYLLTVKQADAVVSDGLKNENNWEVLQQAIERALMLSAEIEDIEKGKIGSINASLERLRLQERAIELDDGLSALEIASSNEAIISKETALNEDYKSLQKQLVGLYQQVNRDRITVKTVDGTEIDIAIAKIVRAYRPNAMSVLDKTGFYFQKFWEFLSDDPREANTEGGIFPAIFGTVMMVLLMSIMVTPFGVIAAVYLREYAKQGVMTQMIRIAVNNLAGVPSIVYGVFGLGFFIYFIGAEIDQIFFEPALPAPTFGTPGLLWASLTLALLTLPVVIVATEEGLARIPRALREGSLALGATKAETLWRIVLPMASPAMMTGLILAVARAAGEVAPLMLVGVVKLAPSLPVDGNYPYMHLDQKFMHLGFHIYDVGFQSPNVEASRPLVYATALLLVVIIALLNFSAVALRNHLREKYKALEM